MNVFTVYQKQNSRLDVFYDTSLNCFTVKDEYGEITKDSIVFKDYLDYVTGLKADHWKQIDFNAIAKLNVTRQ